MKDHENEVLAGRGRAQGGETKASSGELIGAAPIAEGEREAFDKALAASFPDMPAREDGGAQNAKFIAFAMFQAGIAHARALASRPAAETLPLAEYDSRMDRRYIPLPGGWEIQTKGNGSTFRIAHDPSDERWLVLDEHLHGPLERMADAVRAAFVPPPAVEVTMPIYIYGIDGSLIRKGSQFDYGKPGEYVSLECARAALAAKPAAREAVRQSIESDKFINLINHYFDLCTAPNEKFDVAVAHIAWKNLIAHIDTWGGAALAANTAIQKEEE